MLSACVIICVGFGFIQTAPLTYKNPFFSNYDSVDYNELVRATRNLIPQLAPESVFLRPLEVNSHSNDDASVYREGNDFIRLPTSASDDLTVLDPLPQTSYFDHGIQAALPLEYSMINQNVPSAMVWNANLRTSYDTDPDIYKVDQGLNAGSLEDGLYPFVHTSISATLNPVPAVHMLPPVYATHIHETVPSLETCDDFDIDVLNPENSELIPPNLRINRSKRDFLEDWTNDAILNNLLPTMPVPLARGAERSPSYQVSRHLAPDLAQRTGQVMAVFPTSRANGCAIPILMRCSPSLVRGTMTGSYAQQSPQVTSGAAYREDEEQFNLNANVYTS